MMTSNRVILAAGGTGGHIIPALAVSNGLLKNGIDCKFFSDKRGLSLIKNVTPGQQVFNISAGSPFSGNIFQRLIAAIKLCFGVIQSLFYIIRFKPFCVIGFGGYPSAPPLIAANICRLPSLLHEQNARVGRANLFLAKRVKVMLISWENSRPLPSDTPITLTGLPVRNILFEAPNYKAKREFSTERPCHILITGGSLGAEAFAKIIPEVISTLPKKIQKSIIITQQVRGDQLSKLERFYSSMSIRHFCSTFFDDMPNQMAKADIIISRAGAASIAEIAAIGRAALLIPFPNSLDDHQIHNARSLADKNAAIILHQKEIETDPSILAKELLSLIKNPVKCEKLAVKARNLAHKHALNDIISSIKSFQYMNSGGIR